MANMKKGLQRFRNYQPVPTWFVFGRSEIIGSSGKNWYFFLCSGDSDVSFLIVANVLCNAKLEASPGEGTSVEDLSAPPPNIDLGITRPPPWPVPENLI